MRSLVRRYVTNRLSHELVGETRASVTLVISSRCNLRQQLPPHPLCHRFIHVRMRAQNFPASRVDYVAARVRRPHGGRDITEHRVSCVEQRELGVSLRSGGTSDLNRILEPRIFEGAIPLEYSGLDV